MVNKWMQDMILPLCVLNIQSSLNFNICNFLNSSLHNSYKLYNNKRIFMTDGNEVPIYFTEHDCKSKEFK